MLKKVISRKIALITLAVVLMSMLTSFDIQSITALHPSNSLTPISKIKEKRVTVLFPMPQVTKIGRYDWLKIENCSYLEQPGQPMLPVKTLVIKLPEWGTVTNLRVEKDEVLLEQSFSILPASSPTILGLEAPAQISEDPTIYQSDSFFPKDRYVYREAHGIDPETSNCVKYLIINLFPLRFLPSTGKITLAEKVSVAVTYVEPPNVSASPTVLKNLIITSPALETYALELGRWKNNTGICSEVLTTTWIYSHHSGVDNQEKIRNCIKDFKATYGIAYVTIFGDADHVPIRYAYVPDDHDTYVPTDLYYADLDGSWDDNADRKYADQRHDNVDGIPDVYVGRIPPSLAEYARAAVDKIKDYQKRFDVYQNWTQRIVLAAGTCSADGLTNTDKKGTAFLQEYIANTARDKNVVRLYESAGNLSTAKMASEINKGALFLGFAGHGDPGSGFFSMGWLFDWVVPLLIWNGFGISDVQSLTNGYKLPVVTTMSCSTARFDDTDCLGEWFVLKPDGGAIGYFGATRVAYGYFDEWAPYGFMGEMERRIYENFFEGHTRLGQMWGESVSEYVGHNIWNYTYADNIDVKTFMEFELLGDPTLKIGQEWKSSTVYLEGAYNKPQSGSAWSKVNDPSSWSGMVMKASASSQNGGVLFGPYIATGWDGEGMVGRPYEAAFSLKAASNLSTSEVARIDALCDGGTVLQSKMVKSSDFVLADTWQDFKLTFVVPSRITHGLEFRIVNFNHGVTDVCVDKIGVTRAWNSSIVCFEGVYNKPQSGSSWSKVNDPSSWSGSVMRAPSFSPNGGCLFGPYIRVGWDGESAIAKPYVARFRLKVSSNIETGEVIRIDVCYNGGFVLQSMVIKASDFHLSDGWQDFTLDFAAPSSMTSGLEFRIFNLNHGVADMYADIVLVEKGWDAATLYFEAAYNKPQSGSSWSPTADSSSRSGLVMKASTFSANGGRLFGPYIKKDRNGESMLGKPYTVAFRLKVSSNVSTNDVVYVDVCYNGGAVLQSKVIRASDFASANTWQDFHLSFIVPDSLTHGVEFRLMNLNGGIADVFADTVLVLRDVSVVYLEAACSKPQVGSSWVRVFDSSSLSGIVMKASVSSPNGGFLFGPYITKGLDGTEMGGKSYVAAFRLKVSSNVPTDSCAYVDVFGNCSRVLASMVIRASDLVSPNAWQDFHLAFDVPISLIGGLEFRIANLNNGIAEIFVDKIIVRVQ